MVTATRSADTRSFSPATIASAAGVMAEDAFRELSETDLRTPTGYKRETKVSVRVTTIFVKKET